MGKPTGFKEFAREAEPYRDPASRLGDYEEIYTTHNTAHLQQQGARCMDCGVPFCQSNNDISAAPPASYGCPIHNLIPEWNDLVYRGQWRDALDRLHKTNNFPEFTGRVCPAPCEGSCVLGITDPAVTIKNIECAIVDRGFDEGWITAMPPSSRTGKKIAIIGSGPTGLTAAAQLNQAGHQVTVYERSDRLGGLLMYGIPNMKLDKGIVERRIDLLREEGIEFIVNAEVGGMNVGGLNVGGNNIGGNTDTNIDVNDLTAQNDILLFAVGSTIPRDLPIPGREGEGVHFAMEFLHSNTKSLLDSRHEDGAYISAKDKDVIVIGGGDTGTDCIGTSLRHGCKSLVNFEVLSRPPEDRTEDSPWPTGLPRIFRVDYGHSEAAHLQGEDPRVYSIMSKSFIRDESNHLKGVITVNIDENFKEIPGTEKTWPADLIFLSMGFLGPEHECSDPLKLDYDERSNYLATKGLYKTSVDKVYAAGDCRSGQSLVVRAINEGREVAREIDKALMGSSQLP